MKDEADKIIDELLAPEGQMTRKQLRAMALRSMRDSGVNPNEPGRSDFLRHTMIVLAAEGDAEVAALLARATGAKPFSSSHVTPTEEEKRAAAKAIEGFAGQVKAKRNALH